MPCPQRLSSTSRSAQRNHRRAFLHIIVWCLFSPVASGRAGNYMNFSVAIFKGSNPGIA